MLRITARFFVALGGSGRPVAGTAPRSTDDDGDWGTPTNDVAAKGVYLPWTARPSAVTYRVHKSQWKFADSILASFAATDPVVFNDSVREKGLRDFLTLLEEPAVALRRQQAREVRQLKNKEAGATAAAASLKEEELPDGTLSRTTRGRLTSSREERDAAMGNREHSFAEREPSESELPVAPQMPCSGGVTCVAGASAAPKERMHDSCRTAVVRRKGLKSKKPSRKNPSTMSIYYI